jgi:hypothetical protein
MRAELMNASAGGNLDRCAQHENSARPFPPVRFARGANDLFHRWLLSQIHFGPSEQHQNAPVPESGGAVTRALFIVTFRPTPPA